MTDFRANVKSATINMHKKEISVSFVMFLDDDNLERAKELAFYIGKGELVVSATTRQMSFAPLPRSTSASPQMEERHLEGKDQREE